MSTELTPPSATTAPPTPTSSPTQSGSTSPLRREVSGLGYAAGAARLSASTVQLRPVVQRQETQGSTVQADARVSEVVGNLYDLHFGCGASVEDMAAWYAQNAAGLTQPQRTLVRERLGALIDPETAARVTDAALLQWGLEQSDAPPSAQEDGPSQAQQLGSINNGLNIIPGADDFVEVARTGGNARLLATVDRQMGTLQGPRGGLGWLTSAIGLSTDVIDIMENGLNVQNGVTFMVDTAAFANGVAASLTGVSCPVIVAFSFGYSIGQFLNDTLNASEWALELMEAVTGRSQSTTQNPTVEALAARGDLQCMRLREVYCRLDRYEARGFRDARARGADDGELSDYDDLRREGWLAEQREQPPRIPAESPEVPCGYQRPEGPVDPGPTVDEIDVENAHPATLEGIVTSELRVLDRRIAELQGIVDAIRSAEALRRAMENNPGLETPCPGAYGRQDGPPGPMSSTLATTRFGPG